MTNNPHRIAQSHSARTPWDPQGHAAPQISRACPSHLPQRLAPGICSNQEQAKPTIITRRRAGSAIALQGFALKADTAAAQQGAEKEKARNGLGLRAWAAESAFIWCAEPDSTHQINQPLRLHKRESRGHYLYLPKPIISGPKRPKPATVMRDGATNPALKPACNERISRCGTYTQIPSFPVAFIQHKSIAPSSTGFAFTSADSAVESDTRSARARRGLNRAPRGVIALLVDLRGLPLPQPQPQPPAPAPAPPPGCPRPPQQAPR